MPVRLAAFEDQLPAGTTLEWKAAPRAIYVRRGVMKAVSAAGERYLSIDMCALFTDALKIVGDGELWTYELAPHRGGALVAPVDHARTVMAVELALDPAQPILFRADRVSFAPGVVTPKHGHKGPGIRRLLYGRLIAEIADHVFRIDGGDAWFETGADPVIGRNIAPNSGFFRAMALKPELKGQPTFVPWSKAEEGKPRGTVRHEFFDEIVRLPG